jgi:rod shape-determining protein MreD
MGCATSSSARQTGIKWYHPPVARFFFAVLLLLTALVQATFFPALDLLGIVPDLALVLLLIWSATRGVSEGLVWAFGLGLWMDLLAMDPLGSHSLAFMVVAVIGGLTGGRLLRSGFVLPMLTVFGATLAYDVVTAIVAIFGGESVDAAGMLRMTLTASLLNALLVPFAYVFLLAVDRWIPRHV